MSETKFSREVVEAFAAAWASIDGKSKAFEHEKGMPIPEDMEAAGFTGHYIGYMADAEELLDRATKRGARIAPEVSNDPS